MLSFILLDDLPNHNRLLAILLDQIIAQEKLDAQIALTATESGCVLNYAKEHPDGNVYFLDIEIDEERTGVDICRSIRAFDPSGYIVYVSAYSYYAMDCVRSHAFDFLLKPFTRVDLRDCLLALMNDRATRSGKGRLFPVTLGSRTLFINPMDIIYMTVRSNFITALTTHGETTWRGGLQAALDQFKTPELQKISRFCAVNLAHVKQMEWSEEFIVMDDDKCFPVSRRMRGALRARLKTGAFE